MPWVPRGSSQWAIRSRVDYLWQVEQERQVRDGFLTCSASADAGEEGACIQKEKAQCCPR